LNNFKGRVATTTGAQRTLVILEAKKTDFVVYRLLVYITGNRGNFYTCKKRLRESGEQYLLGGTSDPTNVLESTPFLLKKGESLVAQATPTADGDWVYDVEWKEAAR